MHLNPTHNDLAKNTRAKIVELCNALLADGIDLMLQGKQAHWNLKGPSFIALHELFDKIVDEIEGHNDEIAERAVQLGGTAVGTLQAVAKATSLPPYPIDVLAGLDHVKHFTAALAKVAKSVRHAIDQATELQDAGTADLFTGVSRSLDKSLWLLEAHLQGNR